MNPAPNLLSAKARACLRHRTAKVGAVERPSFAMSRGQLIGIGTLLTLSGAALYWSRA